MSLQQYDLTRSKYMIVSGDGNALVRHGFDLLGLSSEYVLNCYHLY